MNNIDYTLLKAMISIHKTEDLLKKGNICQKLRQKRIIGVRIDRLNKRDTDLISNLISFDH